MKSSRDAAERVVQTLQRAGYSAFWVGGCVRDFLLGREPEDYDVATSASPVEIESLFAETVPVGREFGVVIVVLDHQPIQVATFRSESDYEDGRHPTKVSFGNARADAARRDFTINGLFYNPATREVHDWVAGQADLCGRLIRTIGDPRERFREDHLRLLRAVRLAAQLGFEVESATMAAVRDLAAQIRKVSAERIRAELVKLFRPRHAARGLELLRESGLLREVLPELEATVACEQSPDYHPEGTVFTHIKLMLEHMRPDAPSLVPWAVLLHDIAKPVTARMDPDTGTRHFYGHERIGADMAARILERLRFPRKEVEETVQAVRFHMQFKDALEMRTATLRRMLMRETFPLELELHRLDCVGSHGRLDIYEFLLEKQRELESKPEIRPPLLTGDDLLGLGMKPGPAMGQLLEELRDKQLQEELTTAEQAREWVQARLRGGQAD